MADFLAVLICSDALSSPTNDKNTGIAASGLTTEKSEVKLATNNAPTPITSVEKEKKSLIKLSTP